MCWWHLLHSPESSFCYVGSRESESKAPENDIHRRCQLCNYFAPFFAVECRCCQNTLWDARNNWVLSSPLKLQDGKKNLLPGLRSSSPPPTTPSSLWLSSSPPLSPWSSFKSLSSSSSSLENYKVETPLCVSMVILNFECLWMNNSKFEPTEKTPFNDSKNVVFEHWESVSKQHYFVSVRFGKYLNSSVYQWTHVDDLLI